MSREILLRALTDKNSRKKDGIYGEDDFNDGRERLVESQ